VIVFVCWCTHLHHLQIYSLCPLDWIIFWLYSADFFD
jgi:hypothetical protein